MIKRVILILEIFLFFSIYFYGSNGYNAINQLEQQNSRLKIKIKLLKKNNINLQRDIDQWEKEPFFKEKFAREFLQMAYENEKIYYFS